MSALTIKWTDSRSLIFEKEGKYFGGIKFEGFFRQNISVISPNNQIYEFSRKSIWKDTFQLKQGNEIFFTCHVNPFGKAVIKDEKNGTEYRVKSKSFFNNRLELTDSAGNPLLTFQIKYSLFLEVKEGTITGNTNFEEIKNPLLLCSAALLGINEQRKKSVVITS